MPLINMMTLSFKAQNEIVYFVVKDRVVVYFDKIWNNGIQIYPLQKANVEALSKSRSPLLNQYAKLIIDANTGKNLEEYEKCKTEEDLAFMIRKDSASQGLVEIRDN